MMTVVLNKELRLIIYFFELYNLKEIGFDYANDKNMKYVYRKIKKFNNGYEKIIFL